jgi:hypothetical protein
MRGSSFGMKLTLDTDASMRRINLVRIWEGENPMGKRRGGDTADGFTRVSSDTTMTD